jgi:sugar transferase (PEP-CTERM/EpsH1 system associated)
VRVLFLTHRLPYAPNRGDRVRAFHIVRSLASRVDLDLVSLVHDRSELAQAERLQDLGVRVAAFQVPRSKNYAAAMAGLAGTRPLTHLLLDAPGVVPALKRMTLERRPDVVLAYCSGMARFAMEAPLAGCPLVLDLVDVDSEKWAALAITSSWPKRALYRREARYLASFERRAALQASATVVVNEREGEALQRLAPEAAIHIIPNGVDLAALQPRSLPGSEPDVVFCGVMDYPPNVDGVLWFSREVWPIIRARRSDARFFVVGSDPSPSVRHLQSTATGIEVVGAVAEVQSRLWSSAVSVAPLVTARGVQNKVLEALAAGLPTVVTSQVFAGLPHVAREGCLVADTADIFARQVLSLLGLSGQERRSIAAKADLTSWTWERQLAPLHDILAAASQGPGPVLRG